MATFAYPLTIIFGTGLSGLASSVQYEVVDQTGTVQIAFTNTGIFEETDYAGSADTGVYTTPLTLNSSWGVCKAKAVIEGQQGVVAIQTLDTGAILAASGGGGGGGEVTGYAENEDPATIVLGAQASSWDTAGTIGAAINNASSAGNPWSDTGDYDAGTKGYLLQQCFNILQQQAGLAVNLVGPYSSTGDIELTQWIAASFTLLIPTPDLSGKTIFLALLTSSSTLTQLIPGGTSVVNPGPGPTQAIDVEINSTLTGSLTPAQRQTVIAYYVDSNGNEQVGSYQAEIKQGNSALA